MLRLSDYLKEILIQNRYDAVLYYEPIVGLTLIYGDEKRVEEVTGEKLSEDEPTPLSLTRFANLLEQIDKQRELAIATIFNYGSRIKEEFVSPDQIAEFYYKTYRILQNSTPKKLQDRDFTQYNIICLLVDKENDIPAWYISENQKIKSIPIPKPDFLAREIAIKALFKRVRGYGEAPEEKRKLYESIFIEQTNGLFLYEIRSIVLLALKVEG